MRSWSSIGVADVGEPQETHFAFDFVPLQSPDQTRIFPFYENLKKGRLTTTRCKGCGATHWQPRVVCPDCNGDEMDWVDLPANGKLFAFTAVYAGAPLGMERDVPFVVAVVELDGAPMKVVARIDDAKYEDLKIGDPVRLKVHELADGRVWFRFVPT
ncbi:MAG: Zn-ribbon domain-containing OB-fold protein [Methanobacteriota archaeon]|nr:MAG: Zn-ribbon domain-containing OB-fold protein [Euryarchaeota archaeon]